MSEENLEPIESTSESQPEQDLDNDKPLLTTSPEEPEVVKEAKKTGHLSKEQYIEKYGSEEGYKTEEQFVQFGKSWEELKPKIDSLHKKLDDREKEIKALIAYNERLSQEKLNQRKMELEAKLQQARDYNNSQDVEQLTIDKIKLEQEEQKLSAQKEAEERQQVDNDFIERNKHWFNSQHQELITEAQQLSNLISIDYTQNRIPLSYSQLATLVEKAMIAKYPDVVSKPTVKPVPVLSQQPSSKPVTQSIDRTFSSMSEDLKRTFNALHRNNPTYWTKEKYLNKLKQDGEI